MRSSFKDIKKSKRDPKRMAKISYFLYQPIADVLTWIFINLGLSANTVSFLMVLLSIVGAILLFIPVQIFVISGLGLYILSMIVDHSDGMVATIRKQFSKKGQFLDHTHHIIEISTTFLAVGIFTSIKQGDQIYVWLGIFITLGLLATIYLRDMFLFTINLHVSKDHQYRKLPIVLLYGEFFKIWLPILLLSVIFDFTYIVMIIACLWVCARILILPVYYYLEVSNS